LRRFIIIGVAVAALAAVAGASVASAAGLNNYTAKLTFKPSKAGKKKKPAPIGFTENLGATNVASGLVAAPLVDIKTTIYGVESNGNKFPTCDGTQITVQGSDSFCPKKALVATGPVDSWLGGTTLSAASAIPCHPFLHVWNGGHGTLWFFFTTDPNHQCAGLRTGQTAAYPGHIKQHGKNMVTDVPLPPDVSTSVANQPNFYGSLVNEALTFSKTTVKKGKKIYGFQSSFACKKGKRPYSVAFTAVDGAQRETKTVSGSARCSK
jgi:hypothetical protein